MTEWLDCSLLPSVFIRIYLSGMGVDERQEHQTPGHVLNTDRGCRGKPAQVTRLPILEH